MKDALNSKDIQQMNKSELKQLMQLIEDGVYESEILRVYSSKTPIGMGICINSVTTWSKIK